MAKEAVEKIKLAEEEAFRISIEAEKEAKKIISDAKAEAKELIADEKQKAMEDLSKSEEEARKKGEELAFSHIEENKGKNEAPIIEAKLKKNMAIEKVIKLLFF